MVLGGSCPGGNCPGGSCPRGVIALQGSRPRGSCPQGSCPRGSCPRGSCPRCTPYWHITTMIAVMLYYTYSERLKRVSNCLVSILTL